MSESISVSALNAYARQLIERDEVLSQIWVEGEISGLSLHHRTGNLYFSVRDSAASVRAVMFCNQASKLRFMPKDGMYAVFCCKVTLYERDGAFQIYVHDILPRGAGAVQQKADAVRDKLAAEGLFDPSRKRPLPPSPKAIGVITSSNGAALQDIISVIGRRDPTVHIKVFPVHVQGPQAVAGMLRAIELANTDPSLALVIIARGGGSKEDLWEFNDESLVRAASGLRMPLIAAVGHETDVTLIDFVADVRAATPSAAAELAVPDLSFLLQSAQYMIAGMRGLLDERLDSASQRLTAFQDAVRESASGFLRIQLSALDRQAELLRSLDPMNVLRRGYARVTKKAYSISSVTALRPGDAASIQFADGTAACRIESIEEYSHEEHDL